MKSTLTIIRAGVLVMLVSGLSGCFLWPFEGTPKCDKAQEYKTARSTTTVEVPGDLDEPSPSGRLVIPEVGPDAQIRQTGEPCLDLPPDYGGTS